MKELCEEWMSAVKPKVNISTYANYRMKVDKHILPDFGGIRYEKPTSKIPDYNEVDLCVILSNLQDNAISQKNYIKI